MPDPIEWRLLDYERRQKAQERKAEAERKWREEQARIREEEWRDAVQAWGEEADQIADVIEGGPEAPPPGALPQSLRPYLSELRDHNLAPAFRRLARAASDGKVLADYCSHPCISMYVQEAVKAAREFGKDSDVLATSGKQGRGIDGRGLAPE